jgi:hypothetical protein
MTMSPEASETEYGSKPLLPISYSSLIESMKQTIGESLNRNGIDLALC